MNGSFHCKVNGAQPTITTYTVAKQGSTVTATAPKTVKKNQAFTVSAKVAGQYKAATGKVTVKAGKTVVGTGNLKAGKSAVKVAKGLAKTTTLTVSYAGDKSTNAGSAKVKVTVK